MRRRRSVGEMVLFTLFLVSMVALLVVAAREQDEQPPVTVGLTQDERVEIVGRWYGEVYPEFVAPRR